VAGRDTPRAARDEEEKDTAMSSEGHPRGIIVHGGGSSAGGNPGASRAGDTGRGTGFDLVAQVVRHGWDQEELEADGDYTRLAVSVAPNGSVRGTVQRAAVFHHPLEMDGWELTGPPQLPAAWAAAARRALAQLRLRVAGQEHTAPDATGRWNVTVRHRLRIAAGRAVPGALSPHGAFTPTEMFVEVRTRGEGWVGLFGDGPVETDSARYSFSVGADGVAVFDQLDVDDQVPEWAQGPAVEVARRAFALLDEADERLADPNAGA
jgi:hypothetical protein